MTWLRRGAVTSLKRNPEVEVLQSFRLRFFCSVLHFQVVDFVSGMFLKIVCMLQLRRSISGCGFSVSVDFG